MENTTVKRHRLYIVSFGASDKYRYVYNDVNDHDDLFHHPHPLEDVQRQLKAYLEKEFPGDNALAYYYTPSLEEISWEHRHEYAYYPELNAAAVEKIKHLLANEVRDENSLHRLNNNAPVGQ